jgi:hypothetical protein
MTKQKLELTWIGKEKRPKLEPRILLENSEKSYHAKHRVTDSDIFDNRLIFVDNLLALKALEQEFSGKVKCVYIDPPFNTGAAFEHYNDSVEHSIWLGLMRDRLEILKRLLKRDGVIFIHIDDKEMAYLKIVCDEVFGRDQFLNMIVVKTSDPSGHKTVNPSPYSQTEYVLMYARERSSYQYEQIYVESSYDPGYGKIILNRDEHYSKWKASGLNEVVATSLNFDSTRTARKAMGRMTFDAAVAGYALEHKNSVFQATAISDAAGRNIVNAREESKRKRDEVICIKREGFDDVYVLNGRQVYFYSSKAQLAEALAKLEGFTYAPSESRWWQHGHSSERDFIYVTTQNLSAEQLQALSDEVGAAQSLLICCSAFRGVTAAQASERWPNLTLKKIPKMVLARCEWGHDDYSLNVANLPMAAPEKPPLSPQAGRRRKAASTEPDLYEDGGEDVL